MRCFPSHPTYLHCVCVSLPGAHELINSGLQCMDVTHTHCLILHPQAYYPDSRHVENRSLSVTFRLIHSVIAEERRRTHCDWNISLRSGSNASTPFLPQSHRRKAPRTAGEIDPRHERWPCGGPVRATEAEINIGDVSSLQEVGLVCIVGSGDGLSACGWGQSLFNEKVISFSFLLSALIHTCDSQSYLLHRKMTERCDVYQQHPALHIQTWVTVL